MKDLNYDLAKLKTSYRELFLKIATQIEKNILSLKPNEFTDNNSKKHWQKRVLNYLEQELVQTKSLENSINELRQECNCAGCGVCCKFAVSEFSPEELKQKAKNGDNYAKQFTSVFVPYETPEQAAAIYPEYTELLKSVDGYYIYHCPKVTQDNKCPDYENRPQICRDFPDNPIAFLPTSCGFRKWKTQTEQKALYINAKLNIIEYYRDKIYHSS